MHIIQCVNKEYIDPYRVSRQSQLLSGVTYEHILFSYDDLDVPHIKLPEPDLANNTPFDDVEFKGMVMRLYAFDWLKANGYGRVLYIDSDTLIQSDLSELETFDLEGHWLAAAPENQSKYFNKDIYAEKYPEEEARRGSLNPEYFNSGVLLVDLHKFDGSFTEGIDLSDTIYPDQDYLNKIGALCTTLPRTYNCMVEMRITDLLETEHLVDVYTEVSQADIAHFAGIYKPYTPMPVFYYGLQMPFERYFEVAKQTNVSARFLLTVRDNVDAYKSTTDIIKPFL